MKNILVASDLSTRSDRAVRRAYALAERHAAALTVITVIDEDLPYGMLDQFRAASAENLGGFCDTVSDYPRTMRVEVGDPLRAIHNVAEEIDADLIVLGVHRSRPWADLVRGATMERLVRGTERPVLLAADPGGREYRRIVSGLDFSPASLAALKTAAKIAPTASMKTFHAVHVPFRGFLAPDGSAMQVSPFLADAKSRMAAWMEGADAPEGCGDTEFIIGGVGQALGQVLAEGEADLLAVGAHGRPSYSPSYLGGFTEDLLRHPPCDILVSR